MKKFLLVLFAAGLTSTAAFAQAGGLTASDNSTLTVRIKNSLSIQVTEGQNLHFNLKRGDDFLNPAVQRLNTGLRVSSAADNAAVTVLPSGDLTDAITGLTIPIGEVSVGITGSAALTPLSLSTPVTVISGITRGISDYSVDVSVEGIEFGEYAIGEYVTDLGWTVTQL